MRRIIVFPIGIALAAAAMWHPFVSAGEPVHEVQIVAKKFAFDPATIDVTAGEPVRLVIRSADTVHGFSIRKLKIDVQVPRGGEPVIVEFTAPPAGRYDIECSEFCGTGHGQMKAALVSVAPTRTAR
jgi:cytochrome c oxidase subunit 2